jgi:hypothetical protein
MSVEERINVLLNEVRGVLERYCNGNLPLFAVSGKKLIYVTMDSIERELKKGEPLEYTVHKHYYPGYKGDNISFLTGLFYLMDEGGYTEYPGAPSYLQALKKKIPGIEVTFTETKNKNGILRIFRVFTVHPLLEIV